jgi:hypothetical protein
VNTETTKTSYKVTIDERNRIAIRRARAGDANALLRLIRPSYYRFDKIRFHATSIGPALARLLKTGGAARSGLCATESKRSAMWFLAFNFDLEFGGFERLVTDLFKSREIPLAYIRFFGSLPASRARKVRRKLLPKSRRPAEGQLQSDSHAS